MNRILSRLLAPVVALLLVACATPQQVPVEIRQGKIEQITDTTIATTPNPAGSRILFTDW